MWWPGAIYDGAAALEQYSEQIRNAASALNMQLFLRDEPIFSASEADTWISEAIESQSDGLLVVLLDRQQHAWPTANKAIDSPIPTVIFSPVGSSFTTNTAAPSQKTGCFICSTDDFDEVRYGMKMLRAGARLRESRIIVLQGQEARDDILSPIGIKLRYLPAQTFIDEYERIPVSEEVLAMAGYYVNNARKQVEATDQDVINGVKSYIVARTLIEREEADGITMDCLGVLADSPVSLPCIAWSKMNDDGVPAACEADLGAVASHAIVQYLFDRPGFQQDPVAETSRRAIIGAHCSCPTRLHGFNEEPEPFDIVNHHGKRDATARTIWRVGQRVTSVDVLPGDQTQMIISSGEVIENVTVPPAGGCVISVMIKFDGVTDVLAYPGFHQVFFYGDYKDRLVQYCKLFSIEPVVV